MYNTDIFYLCCVVLVTIILCCHSNTIVMAGIDSSLATYRDVSRDEAVHLVDGVRKHAAHVMLYAKLQRKLFGRYNMKYAILVSLCSVVTVYWRKHMLVMCDTTE